MKTGSDAVRKTSSVSAELDSFLRRAGDLVDRQLDKVMPAADSKPARLNEAMRYSLFAGGKRLRPALVLAAAEAVGAGWDDVAELACAVEMIHTYSLIHDDLPAMDDDKLRRGKPTCHVAFGEATAILAGDGLLTLAFEMVSRLPNRTQAPEVLACLAKGAGGQGMVGGQQLDLDAEGKPPSLEGVLNIHAWKTAALMTACVEGSAIACGASEAERTALRGYGENVGLAFQIADDVLDEVTPREKLGKTPGKDREQGKATYVAVAGIGDSMAAAREYAGAAAKQLEIFGAKAKVLRLLADHIVERAN